MIVTHPRQHVRGACPLSSGCSHPPPGPQAQLKRRSFGVSPVLLFQAQGTLCTLVSCYQVPQTQSGHIPAAPSAIPKAVGTLMTMGSQLRRNSSKYTCFSQIHRWSECGGGGSPVSELACMPPFPFPPAKCRNSYLSFPDPADP